MTKDFNHNCSTCTTRCDGKSKGKYIFKDDVKYSEEREAFVISKINELDGYHAEKCEKDGYPDIKVTHNGEVFYIEIKAQRRTFMSVKKYLPNSNLCPSETMALNRSDLLRYFKIAEADGVKVFILWCLEERPCVVEPGKTRYFYQDTEKLSRIYSLAGATRTFRRESGKGDVNEKGEHKGVTVNYHFSLNELKEATPKDFFAAILSDAQS